MNMVEVATPEQEGVVDAVLQLPISSIEVKDRIGLFHADKAAALGALIAVDGQRDPIKVAKLARDRWLLVAGLHRLRGMATAGLHSIDAIEVNGSPDELKAIQASENLHRRALAPLERSMFVHAIVEAAEARLAAEHGDATPQQRGALARWENATERDEDAARERAGSAAAIFAGAYSWQDSVAAAVGLGERAIRYDLVLYRTLVEPMRDLVAELAAHPVVGENASALREISSLKEVSVRRLVVGWLIDNPEDDVAQAKLAVGLGPLAKPPMTTVDKAWNALVGNWARLPLSHQRDFLPGFVERLTPGLREQLRAELDAAEKAA